MLTPGTAQKCAANTRPRLQFPLRRPATILFSIDQQFDKWKLAFGRFLLATRRRTNLARRSAATYFRLRSIQSGERGRYALIFEGNFSASGNFSFNLSRTGGTTGRLTRSAYIKQHQHFRQFDVYTLTLPSDLFTPADEQDLRAGFIRHNKRQRQLEISRGQPATSVEHRVSLRTTSAKTCFLLGPGSISCKFLAPVAPNRRLHVPASIGFSPARRFWPETRDRSGMGNNTKIYYLSASAGDEFFFDATTIGRKVEVGGYSIPTGSRRGPHRGDPLIGTNLLQGFRPLQTDQGRQLRAGRRRSIASNPDIQFAFKPVVNNSFSLTLGQLSPGANDQFDGAAHVIPITFARSSNVVPRLSLSRFDSAARYVYTSAISASNLSREYASKGPAGEFVESGSVTF